MSDSPGRKPPSLVPGVVLMAIAAVLMVVVIINPDMPSWLRTTIATAAIVVVVALIGYGVYVARSAGRKGAAR